MNTHNPFIATGNPFTVMFTDGEFEKVMYAPDFEAAKELASAPANWPIEISNYGEMRVVISNEGEEVAVLNYSDL